MEIIAEIKDQLIEVKFKYDPDTIAKIKEIAGRRWNPEKKIWTIPLSSLEEFNTKFNNIIWQGVETKSSNVELDLVDTSLSNQFKLQPFPYQWVGGNFLYKKKKAMIADEMGLGKTMQAIVAFMLYKRDHPNARAIVFCLSSLKAQWVSEISKFTSLSATYIDGNKKQRAKQYDDFVNNDIDMLAINYELMYHDYETILELVKGNCNVLILDEAQKIKNWKSKISNMFIGNDEYEGLKAECVWLLTGTPIENNPEELFNLFKFIDPKVLGNFFAFRNRYRVLGRFNQPLGCKNQAELHNRISPYMMRRRIKDVSNEFPEVMYSNVYLPMSPMQARMHEATRIQLQAMIESNASSEAKQGMLSILMSIANSPELLTMSDSWMAKKLLRELKPKKTELQKSEKLEWIVNYVKEMLANDINAQVVIFTRSARFLELIVKALEKICVCVVLKGDMDAEAREASRVDFVNGKATAFVSTDAGSRGLNLQVANTLINADLPWNPAILQQRNGRIIRLGSSHSNVRIINLYSVGSIDERIGEVIYNKQLISDQIIDNKNPAIRDDETITDNTINKLIRR